MSAALAPGSVRSLTRRLEFVPDPLALFRALTDNGERTHTALLESAEPGSRQAQKSLLVLSSALSITCRGQSVCVVALSRNGEGLLPFLAARLAIFEPVLFPRELRLSVPRVEDAVDEQARLWAPSSLSILREIAGCLHAETPRLPEAVFLAGLFAYDLVAQFETLPDANGSSDFPDYAFVLAEQLIVIDHLKQHAQVVVNVFGNGDDAANFYSAQEAVKRIADEARTHVPGKTGAPAFPSPAPGDLAAAQLDCSDEEFADKVRTLQTHIVAGDAFQIVLSRTFSLPCAQPLAAYECLRELNPSPYLFYFSAGDFILFGASPESAVKVDGRSCSLEISPIAGTRARGLRADGSLDADMDCRLEAELRMDEKENAEHMMLVDLARNDVARVCKPGTRRVVDLLHVERYSHVMHLVSRVRGELKEGLDALHAYQASMNMGTLTGAPKIRAMQLLRQHEPGRRDQYGGAIGYLDGEGSLDTAIVIRAALVRGGTARVRAGAGVVHDSVPLQEAIETRRKAEAVLRAIARANATATHGETCAHVV